MTKIKFLSTRISLGRYCTSFLLEGAAQRKAKITSSHICIAWTLSMPTVMGAPCVYQQNATSILRHVLSEPPTMGAGVVKKRGLLTSSM